MSSGNVLVSFEQISRASQSNESAEIAKEGALDAEKGSSTGQAVLAPEESAAMFSAFGKGLDVLEEEGADRGPHVLCCVDHMAASLLQSYLAMKSEENGKLEFGPTGLKEAKFDDQDYKGWIKSFFTWWRSIVKHDWQSPPMRVETIPDNVRVAVLGDWGTGMYGAPVSAATIRKENYGLVLHLGDVYYSGTDAEVRERFLKLWPWIDGAKNRAVNSNHEMYTGGHSYFNETLRTFGQSSSCFALQNDRWLLVGLDTAYEHIHKGGLTVDQIDWLRDLLGKAGTRRVILFSHHQPFSWCDSIDPKLALELEEFLRAERIFAWYWGHEHRCVIYDRHGAWGLYGRCAGHSGYPYFRDDFDDAPVADAIGNVTWRRLEKNANAPGCLILNGPNEHMPADEDPDKYGTQGHLTLELEGDHLTEVVHLPNGGRLYSSSLT